MTLPSLVTYGQVTGKLVQAVIDGSDADIFPDSVPVQGTVTFTPSVPNLVVPDATAPSLVALRPIKVQLDASGAFAVELVATNNASVTPINWTWTASFALVGVSVSATTFGLSAGSTVDISSVSPIPGSGGTTPGGVAPNLFVQATNPGMTSPGVWFQTGLGTDGHGITIWVEDGS